MGKRRTLIGLGLALASLAAVRPASAAPALPLWPGDLVGALTPYEVRRHDSIALIALRYTVNPVRVTKPSAPSLRDGLQTGEVITVDARRIEPHFAPEMSGIVLNVPEAHVYLVKDGTLLKNYPVAVSAPDSPVNLGVTRVVAMQTNPTWYVPKSIQTEMARAGRPVLTEVGPGPRNPLGPRWIGFWDGSFGFHGTNVPTSIKKYASHGCVRFLAHDIKDLYRRAHIGMRVHVLYQPVNLAVTENGVWVACYPDIYDTHFDYVGAVRTQANRAGVADRIDWKSVGRAAKEPDGIVRNVSRESLEDALMRAAGPAGTPAPQLFHKTGKPAAGTPSDLAHEGEILAPETAPAPRKKPAPPRPRPSGLALWPPETETPQELLEGAPPASWYGTPEQ